MSVRFLLDHEGRCWPAPFVSLHEELRTRLIGAALRSHAIANLGYIEIRESEAGQAVHLHPTVVRQGALVGLLRWCYTSPEKRTALIVAGDGATSYLAAQTIFRTPVEMANHIVVTFNARAAENRLLRAPRALDQMGRDHLYAWVIRTWSGMGGVFDYERYHQIIHRDFAGRYSLFLARSCDDDDLHIHDVGTGLAPEANFWYARCLGRKVEDQADPTYGTWQAGAYRQALALGQPSLDDVDVELHWPSKERRRYTYQRLLLPITYTGKRGVLSLTITDPAINLRRIKML